MFEMMGICEGPGWVVALLRREKTKRLIRTQKHRESMMKKKGAMSGFASVVCWVDDDESNPLDRQIDGTWIL